MDKKQIKITLWQAIAIFIVVLLIILTLIFCIVIKNNKKTITGKIDDWEYNPAKYKKSDFINSGTTTKGIGSVDIASSQSASENIGFSTGGAKDINNFRENIENGYFPIFTDITYNGLFYDYIFNTGKKTESEELFSPSYSCAISKDPISDKEEYYMTVGLNSNIKEKDFVRKKLNLVVVLDISGSMSSSFSSYYYDKILEKSTKEDKNKSKMQIANESVNILLNQLNADDRFGMVLFDNSAYLGKPLNLVSETDMDAIKNHILEIKAQGGTNFEAGYKEGTKLFKEFTNIDSDEYENRIIVITDAMPNYGTTSGEGLLSYVKENSNNGIYTTFIGVGVDFNSELIEEITNVKGANYYAVHNSEDFKARMGEQFEYMVTPLVFDLQLNIESQDYKIDRVYGSDAGDSKNGNIMKVNTLFPSKTTSEGEVKGGVILLKLDKITDNKEGQLKLKVSYKDRKGEKYANSQTIEFTKNGEFYENTGIRKAIVLTRYVNSLKNWILYERTNDDRFIITPIYGITDCIIADEEIQRILGENERISVKLSVSDSYKEVFSKISNYIEQENSILKDATLNQEINLLKKLIKK